MADTTIPLFPTLFKAVDGETHEWDIAVETQDDGTAVIVMTHGRQGGQKQVARDPVLEGKFIGTRRETTPLQQAINEAQSRWNTKLSRKGYGRTVQDSGDVRAVSPMLAYAYEKYADAVNWADAWAQPKLDGYRCKAVRGEDGNVLLFSRENQPILTMPHIVEALRAMMDPGEMWDGELYTHDEAFEQLGSFIKRLQPDSVKIQYHVYDRIDSQPFGPRYTKLVQRLRRGPADILVPVRTLAVATPDELLKFRDECLAQEYEGAMLRHGDAGYQAGKRSKYLLKFKEFNDAEFEIVDVLACEKGSHQDVAKLRCKTPAGHLFDVTAPGTMAEKREVLRRHLSGAETYVGRKLTVEYQGYTETDKPVPRFPRAKKGRKIQ